MLAKNTPRYILKKCFRTSALGISDLKKI